MSSAGRVLLILRLEITRLARHSGRMLCFRTLRAHDIRHWNVTGQVVKADLSMRLLIAEQWFVDFLWSLK